MRCAVVVVQLIEPKTALQLFLPAANKVLRAETITVNRTVP